MQPKSAEPGQRPPLDQAHGLRQMFAANEVCYVPLVHNPQVVFGGVVMERLCAALAEQGLNTLVVDAADSASPPHELAPVDLAACVEPLSNRVSYLAARGLPMHYLDARATTQAFLLALHDASPQANVVLVHAGAADLRRMFLGRTPRPVLLVGAQAASLTDAYGSMKLLSQRLGALTYDVVFTADVSERRAQGIVTRLSDCADRFLGAAVGHTAVVEPGSASRALVRPDLKRLVQTQLKGLRKPDEAQMASRSALIAPAPVPAPSVQARVGSRSRLN